MEPYKFVEEVYTRMAGRYAREGDPQLPQNWDRVRDLPQVDEAVFHYEAMLPRQKDARILDIGFGSGWFIAACVRLGYTNIEGADFGDGGASGPMRSWSENIRALHGISSIGGFLKERAQQYDVIHLSHVIEHIPRYSLFYHVDAIYRALKPGGLFIVRTPNMEHVLPMAVMSLTLGHEYGFSGSNLRSLLELCNFDEVRLVELPKFRAGRAARLTAAAKNLFSPVLKRSVLPAGELRAEVNHDHPFVQFLRWRYETSQKWKNLIFANWGGTYGWEIVMCASRRDRPELFDERCI